MCAKTYLFLPNARQCIPRDGVCARRGLLYFDAGMLWRVVYVCMCVRVCVCVCLMEYVQGGDCYTLMQVCFGVLCMCVCVCVLDGVCARRGLLYFDAGML
jgi:hypothetical protein